MKYFIGFVTLLIFFIDGSSMVQEKRVYPDAFLPDERLEFNIYFEFVLGGHASMDVLKDVEDINGHPCYHIRTKARSTRTVDMFYKVRDQVETWRDTTRLFSRRFKKKLREGDHKYDRRVDYFPEDSLFVAVDRKESKSGTFKLEQPVQDVVSAFYEARTYELEPGKHKRIFIEDDNKQYEVMILVKRRETVEVPAGTFDCVVVEPTLETSGLFRASGTMEIWLTDDEYHMPVLMKSKLYFGRVWAKLMKYRLGEKITPAAIPDTTSVVKESDLEDQEE